MRGESVRGEGGFQWEEVYVLPILPSGVIPSPPSRTLHFRSLLLVGRHCCHTPCDGA